MRDNKWLEEALDELWRRYFVDIRKVNPIKIKFGRNAKRSLGSIRFDKNSKLSTISINGILASPEIPEFVPQAVIAHELTHYAHGFNSEHEKHQQYPHLGGAVTNELKARGLGELVKQQKKWVKENWRDIVAKN